jgi:hypothetical protein
MPCACKNPPLNVPDNVEWGPVFWQLLHGLAERSGSVAIPGLRGDEIRAWRGLLSSLSKALPCEDCRNHLTNYILIHPINIPDNYDNLKNTVKLWLYNLHEDVNVRLRKTPFPYDMLQERYSKLSLKYTYDILQVLIKRSVLGSAVSLMSWNNWSKYVKILFGLYN